jgi:hypothetical protein
MTYGSPASLDREDLRAYLARANRPLSSWTSSRGGTG